jgi:hypothetical protein
MAFTARQHVLDPLPLIVAKGKALHGSASGLPTPHESEKN